MKTYQIRLKSKDGNREEVQFLHRGWLDDMRCVVNTAVKLGESISMVVIDIKRVD